MSQTYNIIRIVQQFDFTSRLRASNKLITLHVIIRNAIQKDNVSISFRGQLICENKQKPISINPASSQQLAFSVFAMRRREKKF